MAGVLEQLPAGASVAIVRLRSLGDCVLTTPAIRLLKSERPDLELSVVVDPRFAAVFSRNPDVSRVLPPSLHCLRSLKPTLCLNLHGGTRSTVLTTTSGARWRAGFQHFRYGRLYNVSLPRAQEILNTERAVHTAEHLASAVFHLGVPVQDVPPACLFAAPLPPRSPYAVLHPFASQAAKTWPANRFLQLAKALQSQSLTPVFLGGPSDDTSPFHGYEIQAGQTLEATKSLLSAASLFVGNDSGPAHMAAAFQVPSVVLFGASDPVIWAPWHAPAEQLIARDGLSSLSLDQVLSATERLRVPA